MKTKLKDLNEYLFLQIERLSEENVKGEKLKEEIERSKAITSVAREIIAGGSLALKAQIAAAERVIPSVPDALRIDPTPSRKQPQIEGAE